LWLDKLKNYDVTLPEYREIPLPLSYNGTMALLATFSVLLFRWRWPRCVLLCCTGFYAVFGVAAGFLRL
jgi:hypothetical protein